MTQWLLTLVPEWGALLVGLVNFLSCIALPVPASLVMLAGGAFSAAGDLDPGQLWGAALAGALAGDQAGYLIGRTLGPRALPHLHRRRRTAALVDRATAWLDRRRLPAIFLSRWLVSALGPYMNFAAGAMRMNWLGFTLPGVAGECLWVSLYLGLGWAFSAHVQALGAALGNLALAVATGVVAVVIGRVLLKAAAEHPGSSRK